MTKSKSVCGFPLLDVRLWFHSVAFLHLAITAWVTLSIDTTVDEDPNIRMYIHVRWKLLTCWFNLIMLAYFPLCIYCSWQQKLCVDTPSHVVALQHIADVVLTSILLPTTMVADILFWGMMYTDPGLLAPPRLFSLYLPTWCQHSMHSVSMAVVMIDLVITPRRRPESLMPRLCVMTVFFATYFLVMYVSYLRGEVVYAGLELLNVFQQAVLVLACYAGYLTFFTIQWSLIKYMWSHNYDNKKQ